METSIIEYIQYRKVTQTYFVTTESKISSNVSMINTQNMSKNKVGKHKLALETKSMTNNQLEGESKRKDKSKSKSKPKNNKKDVIDNEFFLYGKYVGHSKLVDKDLIFINLDKTNNLLKVSIPKNKSRPPLQFPITNLYPVAQKEIYKFICDYAQKYKDKRIQNEAKKWENMVKKTIQFRNKNKENQYVQNKFVLALLFNLRK